MVHPAILSKVKPRHLGLPAGALAGWLLLFPAPEAAAGPVSESAAAAKPDTQAAAHQAIPQAEAQRGPDGSNPPGTATVFGDLGNANGRAGLPGSADSATGRLLGELRERAGISPPGQPAITVAPAQRAASATGLNAPGESAADLDPDLKEALKQARDWIKETVPAKDGLGSGATPARTTPAFEPERPEHPGAAADTEPDPGREAALQRAALNAKPAEPAARSAGEGAPPFNPIPEFIQAVRDLLLHPATWLVIALVLLLKLVIAAVTLRSRRRAQSRRRTSHQPHLVDGSSLSTSGSARSRLDRPRHLSRHGQRQRSQQQ